VSRPEDDFSLPEGDISPPKTEAFRSFRADWVSVWLRKCCAYSLVAFGHPLLPLFGK